MTAPILPSFVLQLFENEVKKIVEREVKKVCELYELNFTEVREKLGLIQVETTDVPGFRIMKKKERFAPPEERCIARMLHDLEIKQCSNHKKKDDLCGLHLSMGKLKYGTILDPIPDELRPEVLNEKGHTKIY